MVNFQIGLVGKPNVGKSTFFAALTSHDVSIASYPFTTIKANRGIGYVRKPCPHKLLGKPCNPKNSVCIGEIRFIPVELVDVAGLVPNAHEGRGMGNRFLDNLRTAKALIHILDASGATDLEGNPIGIGAHDPIEDIIFLEDEIAFWIKSIVDKNFKKISRKVMSENVTITTLMFEQLSGLGVTEAAVSKAINDLDLTSPQRWNAETTLNFARYILKLSKAMVIAANKADKAPRTLLETLIKTASVHVIPTSADYELALIKAARAKLIEYTPGDSSFHIINESNLTDQQKGALSKIKRYLEQFGSTGVQQVLEYAVFNLLKLIAVYPVEDENKWCDKDGNVLPDVYLLEHGATARDLAYKVHTDLGENFIRAIDAKSKKIVGQNYILNDGDVVKIIART